VSFPEEVFMSAEVPGKVKQLFLLFRKAVEEERKAQKMYEDAMLLCEDKELAKILEAFHKDEMHHEEVIMEQYNKLREGYGLKSE
jgi:rubrerythrin